MARLLWLLRNSFGVARARPVDQATAACHRLEAMEARAYSLQKAATPRRRPGLGGTNRRQPTWPLAAQQQPRARRRPTKCLPRLARRRNRVAQTGCLIHRTAVYETRTYGGVGGAEPRGSPLSRSGPGMTPIGVPRQNVIPAAPGFTKLYLRDTGGKTPPASFPSAGTTA